MTSYRLIPLDDTVVFPGMPVTLSIDPGADTRVLLVPRRGDAFAKVGVVAEVAERVQARRPRLRRVADGRSTARCPAPPPPTATDICGSRWTSAPISRRPLLSPTNSSVNTVPSSRSCCSCVATMAGSARSCDRSPARARWPTPPATRPTSASSRRSTCWRRSTSSSG